MNALVDGIIDDHNALPLVVLDGPRASGKSTVGEMAAAEMNRIGKRAVYLKKVHYVAGEGEYENILNHIETIRQLIFTFKLDAVFLDRLIASEYVMATYHRRVDPAVLKGYCTEASNVLQLLGAKQFVLLPPLNVLVHRMGMRPAAHPSRSWDMNPDVIHDFWEDAVENVPNQNVIYGFHDTLALAHNIIERSFGMTIGESI